MTWDELDWDALDRLRQGFLAAEPSRRAYWKSTSDLACYDLTFGTRIGWKWDAVLGPLRASGWRPPPGPLLDWGCGSGVASRKVVEVFGTEAFTEVLCHDRSPLAMAFASGKLREATGGGLKVGEATPGTDGLSGRERIGTLVISHVWNELPASERKSLLRAVQAADSILWVEPGTHADSHALVDVRERLRAEWGVVAPCPHSDVCGLTRLGKTPHWCHFFAQPPPGVLADSDWVRFAQRAGIDLRSLPYSYLVLDRRVRVAPVAGAVRLIGWPRHYKGYARIFVCDASGLWERTLQERDHTALFKELRDGPRPALLKVRVEGDRIQEAAWLEAPAGG